MLLTRSGVRDEGQMVKVGLFSSKLNLPFTKREMIPKLQGDLETGGT